MTEVSGRGVGPEEGRVKAGRSGEECGVKAKAGPSEERDGAFVVQASRRLPSRSLAARLLASPARSVTAPAPLGPWSVSLRVRTLAGLVYHRRGWSTPARLGPTTSTSETPTERQAVADPRFPDPPIQPLRFLQTDPRLFIFSPFAKAQTSALNYVCGSEKPLRLRLRWVEDEEEAGREAVVERTSERAPLAYPGLTAQLDKDVLEEGESGELRVVWSGTEAVPHVARPLHLELHFWPADEAERGGQRGGEWELRGALEAEVLFRTLPSVAICPEPRFGPGLDPAPDHLTLYRPYTGNLVKFSVSVLSDHTCWVTTFAGGSIRWVCCYAADRPPQDLIYMVASFVFSSSEWEERRAEVVVEWREAADGEFEQVFPPNAPRGMVDVVPRYQALGREGERPSQSRRLTVLFSPEAALRFRWPGPVSVLSHKASLVALWNRSAAEAHWVAVAEASVGVTPDEGRLAGGAMVSLSLSLRRRGRGLSGSVAELGIFFSLGPDRPVSLLFPADASAVAHIRLPLHLD